MSTPESGVVAKTEKETTPAKSIKTYIYDNLKAIETALPHVGLTAEAVARTAFMQIYKNPKLGECDRVSIMRAIIEAASLGLSFSLGRGYLVPFKNKVVDPITGRESWRLEAQFMPGYQGLVDLVRRSAKVKTVVANAVYAGDDFGYAAGLTDDTFRHVSVTEPSDEALTHAYCIIRFLDGGYQWIVLSRKQIDAVRARSKSKDFGPWVTDYASMAIKTAVKRCTKLCPASIELSRAIDLDNDAERGERQALNVDMPLIGDGSAQPDPEPPPQSATQKVSAVVGAVMEKAGVNKGGAGRPPNCTAPGCKNTCKSPIEKEFKKCDACRQKETEVIREQHGTAPQSGSAAAVEPEEEKVTESAAEEEEPAEPSGNGRAIENLVARARDFFMKESFGNKAEAEIDLSSITNGKCAKFEKLGEYLTEHPLFVPTLLARIEGK